MIQRRLVCKGRMQPEREVVISHYSRFNTKNLNNSSRYTHLSAKLESDIDKQERWLSKGRMLCERINGVSRRVKQQ